MTQTKQLTVVDSIRKMEPEFHAALPKHIPSERFTRNAITAVNGNPDLLNPDIDKRSLFSAVMKAAQDGLVLDNREAALVTFNTKNGKQVSYMPMIAGIMKKVRQSGDISVISVQVVKENDSFDYELGDNERMTHKPALTNRGKTIGAYSIVTFKDGEKSREWMDVDQIEAVRKRSRTSNAGPWVTDFDEMARKTVFRRHAKRRPSSSDLDSLVQSEDEDYKDNDVVRVMTEPAARHNYRGN
jgi:recombination protein RecT